MTSRAETVAWTRERVETAIEATRSLWGGAVPATLIELARLLVRDYEAAIARAEAAEAALRELVNLKALHDGIEQRKKAAGTVIIVDNELFAIERDYGVRKPAAWAAARAIVDQSEAPTQTLPATRAESA